MAEPDVFYYAQHTCALASLAALEEAKHAYRAERLAMGPGGAGDESFAAISPLRQVPVLQTATGVIRETGAILTYLADSYPDAAILPVAGRERVEAIQWIGFLGGTLHPVFRLLWRPARWVGDGETAQMALRSATMLYLVRAMDAASTSLGTREWVLGSQRSAIDFYLHVFTRWMGLTQRSLADNLAAHHARVAALPAMERAVAVMAESA